MRKISDKTWEFWFLGSLISCIMPMITVMFVPNDSKIMNYATIALVISFSSFMLSIYAGRK